LGICNSLIFNNLDCTLFQTLLLGAKARRWKVLAPKEKRQQGCRAPNVVLPIDKSTRM
jgi:hypothetical protein